MKKMILGMLGVAALTSSLNANEEEKVPAKEEQNWTQQQREAIEKQMQERSRAFNEDKIQHDNKALLAFISRQREAIMALEAKKREHTR